LLPNHGSQNQKKEKLPARNPSILHQFFHENHKFFIFKKNLIEIDGSLILNFFQRTELEDFLIIIYNKNRIKGSLKIQIPTQHWFLP